MKIFKLLIVFVFSLCLNLTVVHAQNVSKSSEQKPGKLLPSEALALMINAVDSNPQIKRIDNTKPFLPRVITTGLSEKEQFYLGEVYFWNLMPKESLKAYEPLLKNRGNIGRASWKRTMIVLFNGYNKFDQVEAQLKEFREIFKATPEDRVYLFFQVFSVANRYKDLGNHKKVVELINDEINEFDNDGAFLSYRLPIFFIESYKAIGKKQEALKILQTAKDKLTKALENRKKNMPKNDMRFAVHTYAVINMETVVTEKLGYSQLNEKYEKLIKLIDEGINTIASEK